MVFSHTEICDQPRMLLAMSDALGMLKEAQEWKDAAGRLLPKLRQTFFVPGGRRGLYSQLCKPSCSQKKDEAMKQRLEKVKKV